MATTCPREKLSVRNEESFWRRAFWALPLLGIFLVARTSKLPLHPDTLDSILRLGQNGSWSTPQTLHAITFLADITCLNAIVAIESCRGGRSLTTASVSLLFCLAIKCLGLVQTVPLYLFFQYLSSTLSKQTLRSSHLVPIGYSKALLPALIFGYIIPTLSILCQTLTLETKQSWSFIWKFFPIWTAIFHELFARCFKNVPDQDRGRDVASDLVWLRGTYEFLFLLSASTYVYVFFVSPIPLSQLFFGGIWDWVNGVGSPAAEPGLFLKWDEILVFAGTAVWMLLSFRDLKREGRMKTGWVKLGGNLG
ncbi:hypothetical protein V8E51_016376 [Hyaloscypha variabilis]